jgi:hypothetical protein
VSWSETIKTAKRNDWKVERKKLLNFEIVILSNSQMKG